MLIATLTLAIKHLINTQISESVTDAHRNLRSLETSVSDAERLEVTIPNRTEQRNQV